jgi:hypothetical protein
VIKLATIDTDGMVDELVSLLKSSKSVVDYCKTIRKGAIDYNSINGVAIYVSADLYSSASAGMLLNARRYNVPIIITIGARARMMSALDEQIQSVYKGIEEVVWSNNRLNGLNNGLRQFNVEPYEITDEKGNPEAYRIDIQLTYDFIMST